MIDLTMRWRGNDCPEDPRRLTGEPIGMYHCPWCGMMVLAGLPHPDPDDVMPDLWASEFDHARTPDKRRDLHVSLKNYQLSLDKHHGRDPWLHHRDPKITQH